MGHSFPSDDPFDRVVEQLKVAGASFRSQTQSHVESKEEEERVKGNPLSCDRELISPAVDLPKGRADDVTSRRFHWIPISLCLKGKRVYNSFLHPTPAYLLWKISRQADWDTQTDDVTVPRVSCQSCLLSSSLKNGSQEKKGKGGKDMRSRREDK